MTGSALNIFLSDIEPVDNILGALHLPLTVLCMERRMRFPSVDSRWREHEIEVLPLVYVD